MSDEFDAPASASGFPFETLNGALLLFTVNDLETDIKTAYGEKNAIRADVLIIDGDMAGETYDDTLIFPKALIGQLKPKIGSRVLGRLGQGQAKPGQKPPWLLSAPTEADITAARAAVAKTPATTAPAKDEELPPF